MLAIANAILLAVGTGFVGYIRKSSSMMLYQNTQRSCSHHGRWRSHLRPWYRSRQGGCVGHEGHSQQVSRRGTERNYFF